MSKQAYFVCLFALINMNILCFSSQNNMFPYFFRRFGTEHRIISAIIPFCNQEIKNFSVKRVSYRKESISISEEIPIRKSIVKSVRYNCYSQKA